MTNKYPYYKNVEADRLGFTHKVKLFENEEGCEPIKDVCLSVDKTPPAVLYAKASEPPPAAALQKSITAPVSEPSKLPEKNPGRELLLWALSEPKSKEEKEKIKDKPIPKVDLLDVPISMRAQNMPNGNLLANRWFTSSHFIAPTAAEERNGARFPKDRVVTDVITLSWLFKYSAIETHYKNLIAKNIYNGPALEELKKNRLPAIVRRNLSFSGNLDTWALCGQDIQELHHQFQFQREPVSAWEGLEFGRMTDVTASLGRFNFYAAIANVHITANRYNRYNTPQGTLDCVQHRVTITHIYIYAKDTYGFHPEPDKPSQYLGHWNKYGVIVMPSVVASQKLLGRGASSPPSFLTVDTGGKRKEKDIYSLVTNDHYNQWRELHQQGGDFVIYSDLKLVKLERPIVIELEEICKIILN